MYDWNVSTMNGQVKAHLLNISILVADRKMGLGVPMRVGVVDRHAGLRHWCVDWTAKNVCAHHVWALGSRRLKRGLTLHGHVVDASVRLTRHRVRLGMVGGRHALVLHHVVNLRTAHHVLMGRMVAAWRDERHVRTHLRRHHVRRHLRVVALYGIGCVVGRH